MSRHGRLTGFRAAFPSSNALAAIHGARPMKTNTQLAQDVIRELEWEPALDATRLKVSEDDGIVTLDGHVRSFWEKDVAVEAAQRVTGVRAVADQIQIDLPAASQRGDAALARAVANALEWNA